MHAHHHAASAQRRGVVLVLILAMLGLLALIGVSFATITGQAQLGSRKYAETAYIPTSDQVMDYALMQLVNDTTNPLSAIRGHSLLRDMYGNDALNNGSLNALPGGGVLLLTSQSGNDAYGNPIFQTNIPTSGSLASYNLNFTRWIVKFANCAGYTADGQPFGQVVPPVAQTFEVLYDDVTGSNHAFSLTAADTTTQTFNKAGAAQASLAYPSGTSLNNTNYPIFLDGRYLRAFNGEGMAANAALGGNFLYNGLDPAIVPMDEDYDAPDLENWYLALQSADGNVVIPSFHRPGILTASDWTSTAATSRAKILRVRSVDNPGNGGTFTESAGGLMIPHATTGKIQYDVDNDGDGTTDSVWLDLGYPPQVDASGKLVKPLFALTVMGLNGRLPLNTAGNTQGRFLGQISEIYDDRTAGPHSNTYINPLRTPGEATFNHTSHLGYSANEISPLYALQNSLSYDITNPPAVVPTAFADQASFSQFDNAATYSTGGNVYNFGVPVSVTQLRNLLAGTRTASTATATNDDVNTVQVNGAAAALGNSLPDEQNFSGIVVRATPAVPGRWGESGQIPTFFQQVGFRWYPNPVSAGRSNTLGLLTGRLDEDASDDDFDTYDFLLPGQTNPEDYDYDDLAGLNVLPSERIRRFVTPIDPVGVGRIVDFDAFAGNVLSTVYPYSSGSGTQNGYGTGADTLGRVMHLGYFRPPGLVGTVVHPLNYNAPAQVITPPAAPTTPNLTNNPGHGFEAELFFNGGSPTSTLWRGAGIPYTVFPPTTNPTFTGPINSSDISNSANLKNGLPLGSLNRDEADEMNLYGHSPNDSPFGPQDLEWLYRSHDVDGHALTSRLSQLAPISFTRALDAQARRRMFSIDSWETINFAYAHDNPGNSFPNNSRFLSGSTARISNVNDPNPYRLSSASLYTTGVSASNGSLGVPTPSLAHGDRRINLNYPLPVSSSPVEAVRQKWIRESYELLKNILPPEALDTPQELAQLSQYLVNVIDFRDPDGAHTKFVNTDFLVTPATSTTPSILTTATLPAGVVAYDPSNDPAVSLLAAPPQYLVQYGMEYNPVAFNEVLAYSFLRKNSVPTPRLFVELVNTLTQAEIPQDTSGSPVTGYPQASDVDLTGWELVLVTTTAGTNGEDYTCRPDPITGQIPLQPAAGAATQVVMPLSMKTTTDPHLTAPSQPEQCSQTSVNSKTASSNSNNGLQYLVLSNPLLDSTSENMTPVGNGTDLTKTTPNVYPVLNGYLTTSGLVASPTTSGATPPSFAATDDPLNTLTPLTTGQQKYLWLYLRRPANPLNPTDTNNPKVVVDSIRFPFTDGGAKVVAGVLTRSADRDLYSTERVQPFRGGQIVDNTGSTPPVPNPPTAYGFSEQTAPSPTLNIDSTNKDNLFGIFIDPMNNKFQATGRGTLGNANNAPPAPATPLTPMANTNFAGDTYGIGHTLGQPNHTNEPWSFFPFHDRDFMGVAEMLLVPGVAPGLFTKQFVENPPVITAVTGTPYKPDNLSKVTPIGAVALNPQNTNSFPYLLDNFYYTAYGKQVDAVPIVNGSTGDGWHKMLGFFEVPSSANGAIGPAQQGQNFDWYRQATKPGLLNLNLIIDEEVFFGLIDDPLRMNLAPVVGFPPLVATSVNTASYYSMKNKGFVYFIDGVNPGVNKFSWNPANATADGYESRMKTAFYDFLAMRHSTQVLNAPTGTPATYAVLGSNSPERPFHDITYPDIDYTVMRPALLPPVSTVPLTPASNPRDPGVRFSDPTYDGPPTAAVPLPGPPPIPTRRFFGIPDNLGNSSYAGDTTYNTYPTVTTTPTSFPSAPNPPPILDLSNGINNTQVYLGGGPGTDRRSHPAFRTEWLQKVMNLSTVRTHQFAVWVTVGFFEVVQPGNPQTNTPDQVGREVGARQGRNVRYRSFFLLDRSKATGFNPQNPGDFRDVVLYRRRIE